MGRTIVSKKDVERAESATRERIALAQQIVEDETWYQGLPSDVTDELGLRNHREAQAEKGVRLARLVLRDS